MKKKILVLGGAGYIGSQTNYSLIDQGYETIVFDSLEFGHNYAIPNESVFIKGDLLNKEDIRKVFQEYEIEGVIHFAAYLFVGESVKEPKKYYRNNVAGTLNLLEVMLEFGVKNLVFSSTAAVYGLIEADLIDESVPKSPINPYGRTKLMVEEILKDFNYAYGLRSVCLRYFNACGADSKGRTGEDHNPETHLIPLILKAAKGERENITVFGTDYKTPDGTCIRDYIHTMDLASAHILALEKLIKEEINCEQINVATGSGYSVKEIIDTVKNVTGEDINIVYGERREGDPDKLVANNLKAKNILNWTPKYSDIENIVQTAWNWENNKKQD
jgi:UDP-glucose 4-epimerase